VFIYLFLYKNGQVKKIFSWNTFCCTVPSRFITGEPSTPKYKGKTLNFKIQLSIKQIVSKKQEKPSLDYTAERKYQ